MGSAVDQTNLVRELRRYHDAGLGGVHIIPIYGAKGYEDHFIDYLSPKWMAMLAYTVEQAAALDLGVDMTAGTGWCFGGPHVTDREANALVVVKTFEVAAQSRAGVTNNLNLNLSGSVPSAGTRSSPKPGKFDSTALQALVAFSAAGKVVDLIDKIKQDGTVDWWPAEGVWQVYAVSQRPSGQKVKRAAPGGQGHMLNLFYPLAMRDYLSWFQDAFAHYTGPKPRALYHDSYEYRCDWAPDFFSSFEKLRGYRLQTELPALFADRAPHAAHDLSPDHVARIKSDYRETVSDIMAEESLPMWTQWARAHGFITRNEAHGSPGNWLDLYAVADIPETEMFHLDRNKLVSKFASSAAHVAGKNLAAAETGTWLTEHFTETLADLKYLLDDMFLSGINHVFYHGTCYSPDEAAWPGWVFYASTEMNPRNSIWHDVPELNTYASRCQAVLQAGRSDNDVLLYWPIHDLWHNPAGMVQPLTVHAQEWFAGQSIGKAAERLWNRGYAFDYVSDRQLTAARARRGKVFATGGTYGAVVVPVTEHMPLDTFRKLLGLAQSGATVIFEKQLPEDVAGFARLEQRRAEFKKLRAEVIAKEVPVALPANASANVSSSGGTGTSQAALLEARIGKGRVLAGDLEPALAAAGIRRESMFDTPGLMCVRRTFPRGRYYFIANRSERTVVNDWVPVAFSARSALLMDPLTSRTGTAALHAAATGSQVYLQLQPGQSLLLRCSEDSAVPNSMPGNSDWNYWQSCGDPIELTNVWQCKFLQGGPELAAPFETHQLASWTELVDTNAQRFAGTARYTLTFDEPKPAAAHWRLNLGKVCQSARVRLNGRDLGTLITPPFSAVLGQLQHVGNLLEVEVTNVAANRIRDLDRRGIKWKNFYDINLVGLDYKPFDASNWPLKDSGLMGRVTLTPITLGHPEQNRGS
jgi:hypothetical protein